MKNHRIGRTNSIDKYGLRIGFFLLVLLSLTACSPLTQMGIHAGRGQHIEKGSQIECSDQSKAVQKRWGREVSLQAEALLGVLNKQATQREKEKLKLQVEALQKLEESSDKEGLSSKKEASVQEISRYLDRLTKKYFSGWKKAQAAWDESYERPVYDKEEMLKILQEILSPQDYKSFKRMYARWKNKDISKDAANKIYDNMEGILRSYPKLDASPIMEDLTDLHTQTVAVFVREKGGSFSYQEGEQRALPQLSLEEQEECKGYILGMQKILPPEAMGRFDSISIFTDESAGAYAYVNFLDDDAKRWNLSIDKADMEYPEEFCYTAVHEYAHYLSLNHEQMRYFKKSSVSKPRQGIYHDETFEAREGSYIQAYYEQFWKRIYEDRMSNRTSILFYLRHHDEFINSYASTDCAEDFAETFAWYVLDEEVADAVVQQKINFFKQCPELEQEKERIRAQMKRHQIQPEKYFPEYDGWRSIMGG